MQSKHIAILIGATLVGVIGFYIVRQVGKITPAVDIDDQLNALRNN